MLGEEYTDNGKGGEALFCAATALVLITLELIGMSHYDGTRRNLRSIFSGRNTIVTFALKIVLLCFLVTLPIWVGGLFQLLSAHSLLWLYSCSSVFSSGTFKQSASKRHPQTERLKEIRIYHT